MFGRYELRPSPSPPPIDTMPSTMHKYGSYKMDTIIDSIQDVRAILEYLEHPLILVGATADRWVHHNLSTDAAVDVLISTAKLESITDLLIKTGRWVQPTAITEELAAGLRPGTTSLQMVQRDADVLLMRPEHGNEPCVLVRLWSESTYHIRVDQESILETYAGCGRLFNNPWRAWWCPLSVSTTNLPEDLTNIADKIFIPTLPALMKALVHQRRHLWETKSLLCSDAHGLIKRLTERYDWDIPEFAVPLLAMVEPSTRKYLATSFANYERTPTPELPPRLKEKK
ncbi:hypothetical protein F5X99DRAFT_414874 [Biscogniauxia marginata]|nr:hypothetical protein F5X99DRAFT_414874 [Biscogniauxia marginata]